LTTCDEARYWLRITIFDYPMCIRCPHWGRGSHPDIAITFAWEKLEWCGYPMVKKFEDTLFVTDRMHERDRRTDRQTDRETPCNGIDRTNT